jgi:hypothetical protein
MISETFEALSKEAHFTREMLGAAPRRSEAPTSVQGVYFQAFTSLLGLSALETLA